MSESVVDAFRITVQNSLKNDTWLEGNRVRHSLRGYFNMLLVPRAEFVDLQYKPNVAEAVVKEFTRYVEAPHQGEPTWNEITAFVDTVENEEVLRVVAVMLEANLRDLDRYRPEI